MARNQKAGNSKSVCCTCNCNRIGALTSVDDVDSNTDFLRHTVDANGQVTSRTMGG